MKGVEIAVDDNPIYGLPAVAQVAGRWVPARLVGRLHTGRYLVAIMGSRSCHPYVLGDEAVHLTDECPPFRMPHWAWDWAPVEWAA